MVDKKTHFGRAGEYFAMSELLLRGWNVAVPVVDIGDDVFVIDDSDKTTWRLQVKSATAVSGPRGHTCKFTLSRSQLRAPQNIELFYMLILRVGTTWRFLVIPRAALSTLRAEYVAAAKARARGRPPLTDDEAKGDALAFEARSTMAAPPAGTRPWTTTSTPGRRSSRCSTRAPAPRVARLPRARQLPIRHRIPKRDPPNAALP